MTEEPAADAGRRDDAVQPMDAGQPKDTKEDAEQPVDAELEAAAPRKAWVLLMSLRAHLFIGVGGFFDLWGTCRNAYDIQVLQVWR